MAGDCVFCNIIRGRLPAVKLYEDRHVVVFLDIYPAAPGHALVVPKHHAERLEDLPETYRSKLLGVAARVAPAILEATGCEAYNVLINNGRPAGQEIMHVHLHIVPRRTGDECVTLYCRRSKPSWEELKALGERIRTAMRAS